MSAKTDHQELLILLDPMSPLLQRLRMKAPGTYFHSMIVGELAAAAAFNFPKADPLLALVGGQYHDIGKMANPEAFAENQEDGDYPFQPALIAEHVKKGVEMARAFALPEEVIRFIATHHGNLPSPSVENGVRKPYEGSSLPQTVEETLVLLGDSTEAAMRALFARNTADKVSIRDIIATVFADKVEKGQLLESVLIPADLEQVQEDFTAVLDGIYHRRAALERR